MKQLTLLLIIFAHVSVIAQPTLTSNEMAPFGSSWTLTYTQNFSVMDTNIQGANATWNFTAVQPTPTTLTINIVDPAQTPYGPSFPNANYAYVESPNTAYRYFNLTPAKMERVGSWSSSGLKIYNDPQIEYVYPLTMGSYSYDTWDNSSSSTGGIYELQGIGYGTLNLPIGTFNDVLMVRVFIEESFLSFHSYFWYSSTSGIILVQYIPGDGFFVAQSLSYATNISLSSGMTLNEAFENLNYNNPVSNTLSISFSSGIVENVSYDCINSLGQKVLSGNIEKASSSINIEMENLQAGLYFITFREEKSNAARTIKVFKL